jgi:hypothetical protein
MFMFGDSFADTGNSPGSGTGVPTRLSRAWFDPYGLNYEDYNGHWQGLSPSGRFSDFMVQSDVIGMYLTSTCVQIVTDLLLPAIVCINQSACICTNVPYHRLIGHCSKDYGVS